MFFSTPSPVLRCTDCGSRAIELVGPVKDHAVVRCAKCGADTACWADFLSTLGARMEKQEYERRRRLH
jgi:uncharacterized Zn finger protein